tara:strand:- start:629 stop:931 length:303 start_codon:yes stop_codon:yes gene_type:complete
MTDNFQNRIRSGQTWFRLLLALAYFFIVFEIIVILVGFSFVFQFLYRLIKGVDAEHLKNFTEKLNAFSYSSLDYLTFNSDDRPFPFNAWPTKRKLEDIVK